MYNFRIWSCSSGFRSEPYMFWHLLSRCCFLTSTCRSTTIILFLKKQPEQQFPELLQSRALTFNTNGGKNKQTDKQNPVRKQFKLFYCKRFKNVTESKTEVLNILFITIPGSHNLEKLNPSKYKIIVLQTQHNFKNNIFGMGGSVHLLKYRRALDA